MSAPSCAGTEPLTMKDLARNQSRPATGTAVGGDVLPARRCSAAGQPRLAPGSGGRDIVDRNDVLMLASSHGLASSPRDRALQ